MSEWNGGSNHDSLKVAKVVEISEKIQVRKSAGT